MKWRYYTPHDYEMVSEWWKAWRWTPVRPDMLPKLGIITGDGERDIAAAWLYQTDSKIALIEWYITNPSVRGKARDGYVEAVTELLSKHAKDMGFLSVLSIVRNPNLMKRLDSVGFTLEDKQTHIMNRNL